MVVDIGEIGNTCPKCGTFFTGNKCPNCGWEILPVMPQHLKTRKQNVKGVFH